MQNVEYKYRLLYLVTMGFKLLKFSRLLLIYVLKSFQLLDIQLVCYNLGFNRLSFIIIQANYHRLRL